jgi:hypothetical protein
MSGSPGNPLETIIHPWESADGKAQPLSYLISRISAERGQFHHITEDTLAEEIRLGNNASGERARQANGSAKHEDTDTANPDISSARVDLLKYVS